MGECAQIQIVARCATIQFLIRSGDRFCGHGTVGTPEQSGFAFFTAVHVVTCALTKFNPVCNTALAASSNRSGVLADC